VVPGLFQVRGEHLAPVFPGGGAGFAACLPLLFFAYAGFEALAHSAGEVESSTHRLPRVFVAGISVTTVVYLLLSLVIIGVVPPADLDATETPASTAAAVFLPPGLTWVVTLGVIAAIATSLNATMLVPSRLALMLVQDGRAPRALGVVHAVTGTPIPGLLATFAGAALLLITGKLFLALNIAVFALVLLYFLHSLAFLLLPVLDPALHEQARLRLRPAVHVAIALVSLASLGVLLAVRVVGDVRLISATPWAERDLTTVELTAAWGALGLLLYGLARRSAGHVR
jgi:amino acid transporter